MDTGDTSNPVTAEDFVYDYDNIGNRETYTLAGDLTPTTYTSNNLNQYDLTTDPAESFDYDADGNLIEDGTREYTWDAENRLIAVAPASSPMNGDKKLEFKYDYMSRRVDKKVYNWDGAWQLVEHFKFVYDRWNVIAVLVDGVFDDEVLQQYTWGLDLSRSIHGAGGIGGLLGCWADVNSINTDNYFYFHDANGNVGQAVKDDTGYPTVAHYEYDPYGNTLVTSNAGSTSNYVEENPFRFSTKWWDEETGYYAYIYRYYDPKLGRWLNRDPIGEKGGFNLYEFVHNSPVRAIDPLGLWCGCVGIGGSGTIFVPGTAMFSTGFQGTYSTQACGCNTSPYCRVCDTFSLTAMVGLGANVSGGVGYIVTVGGDPSEGLSFSVGVGGGVPVGPGAGVEFNMDVNVNDKNVTFTIPTKFTAGLTVGGWLRFSGNCTACDPFNKIVSGWPARQAKIIACVQAALAAGASGLSKLGSMVVPASQLPKPVSFQFNVDSDYPPE